MTDDMSGTTVENPGAAAPAQTDVEYESAPTRNVSTLLATGPLPTDDDRLCTINVGDRQLGLSKFQISRTTHAGGMNVSATSIAYLVDPVTLDPLPGHGAKAVLEAWIDANPRVIENVSRRTLAQKVGEHGKQFREVSTDVLRDAYTELDG